MAYSPNMDELMFFDNKLQSLRLYLAFVEKLYAHFPDAGMKVQKTQITFTNPRVFACVSMARVRPAKERPKEYMVVTFGFGGQIQSPRIDVATESFPGQWTHHVMVTSVEEINEELMGWVSAAYGFARHKR